MPEERIYTHLIRERITRAERLVFIMQRVVGNPNWTTVVTEEETEVAGVRGVVLRLNRRCRYDKSWAGERPVLQLNWVLRVPADRPVQLFEPRRRRAAA